MNIEVFKKLSKNRQVNYVHREFEKYLKTVIFNAKSIYFNIPETVEDMYWIFMYEVPKIIEQFSGISEKDLMIFIGLKCKFFTLNRCKKLIGKSFIVLNNAVPLNEETANQIPQDFNGRSLNDSCGCEASFDLTIFNEIELQVYQLIFVENFEISDVVKKLNMSRYLVKKTLDSIKKKYEKNIF